MTAATRKRRRRTTPQEPPPSSPSPPAAASTALPEDLMIEILSRVPMGDPLRLRLVCKSWKPLVSDPQCVKSHLQRSIAEINVLASKALDDMIAFELQLNHAPPPAAEEAENAEEEVLALRKELENMLAMVRSLKESLETIKTDVQEIKDRMKCLQSFLQIYLKTATSQ